VIAASGIGDLQPEVRLKSLDDDFLGARRHRAGHGVADQHDFLHGG
jgi:hypothetical protein